MYHKKIFVSGRNKKKKQPAEVITYLVPCFMD